MLTILILPPKMFIAYVQNKARQVTLTKLNTIHRKYERVLVCRNGTKINSANFLTTVAFLAEQNIAEGKITKSLCG